MSNSAAKEGLSPSMIHEGRERIGPRISYTIFFGSHLTREDIEGLGEYFNRADIYVPESLGWDPTVLQDYNEVSLGIKTPEDVIENMGRSYREVRLAELQMLSGSRKPVVFADIPRGHPLYARVHQGPDLPQLNADFKEFTGQIREYLEEDSVIQRERENYIVSSLVQGVDRAIEQNKGLNKRKSVNVLLFLGTDHVKILELFRKQGLEAVGAGNLQSEGFTRWYNSPKDRELSDIDVARAAFEMLLLDVFADLLMESGIKNTRKRNLFIQLVAASASIEDIKKVFQNINVLTKLTLSKKAMEDRRKTILEEFLKEREITIPQNKEELDRILESQK